MTETLEYFLVNITVLECRHLAWPNMDSAVYVKVDNQRNCTPVVHNSDSPFFNEYFTFEFFTTLRDLLDKNISFTVIQPRKAWTSKKTLGNVALDLATVWTQPDHQFFHKWATIVAPSDDPTGGARGYIKLDINILRKGESPNFPNIDPHETDEIEGNLLLPDGVATERQRANYIFKIYRGENLCRGKYLESTLRVPLAGDALNVYLEVFFAGLKGKTSSKKNTLNPVWNESLTLKELFPPLCQRIKIHLCSHDKFQDTVIAVRYIDLRGISNDGEHGFLPTFGPTFLHFYAKVGNVEGYVGKILMSFNTEVQMHSFPAPQPVIRDTIGGLPENNLWKNDVVLIYGILFNTNLIDKKFSDKPISYEINFGLSELQENNINPERVLFRTPKSTPFSTGKVYWFLEYGQDKPCVFIQSYWPDFRRMMYTSNVITKMVDELGLRFTDIEALFIKWDYLSSKELIEKLLLDVINYLSKALRKCIDIFKSSKDAYQTELDKEKKRFYLYEIDKILQSLESIYAPKLKKQCFEKLQSIFKKLQLLADDIQECWPDLYIVMISGDKKVAWKKCRIRDLAYSPIDEEKGKYCGQIQSLFLKPNVQKPLFGRSTKVPMANCEIDIFLWAGLEKDKSHCFKAFPEGFIPPNDLRADALPLYLVAQHKQGFQCRVHIYQGKFTPGSDRSGLCDPFARIVIGGECRETKVAQATLNPTWDQTLVFQHLVAYGDKLRIKSDPPLIMAEFYDQDAWSQVEYIGHSTFKPVIKFREEPYAAPDFPPKLKWINVYNNKEVRGEVFIAAEMLEISDIIDQEDLQISTEVTKIPSQIKPQLAKYRVDVLFWGVRELQKILLLPVTKPKVTIECAYKVLHSETIPSTQQTLNFTESFKFIDVDLPDQEDLSPPIVIKLFDCRSFGRFTLVGTQIIGIESFLCYPMRKEERQNRLLKVPSVEDKIEETNKLNAKSVQVEKKLLFKRNTKERNRKSRGRVSKSAASVKNSLEYSISETNKQLLSEDKTEGTLNKYDHSTKKIKVIHGPRKNKFDSSNTESSSTKSSRSRSSTKMNKKKDRRRWRNNKRTNRDAEDSESLSAKSQRSRSLTKKNKKKNKRRRRNKKGQDSEDSENSSTKSPRSRSRAKKNKKKGKRGRRIGKRKHRDTEDSEGSEEKEEELKQSEIKFTICSKILLSFKRLLPWGKVQGKSKSKIEPIEKQVEEKAEEEDDLTQDWWTRYHASVEVRETKESSIRRKKKCILKIYSQELEDQPEFEGFTDTLQNFKMYKGKRTGDESVDETNITGIFKGALKIYKWPLEENIPYVTKHGYNVEKGYFQHFPPNSPLNFVVRIYIVKALSLRPKDVSGKSDPYIVIKMSGNVINDRACYIPRQINPIFGRCFELKGSFPKDHAVVISIWDWDLTSSDDLIGETKIDIENRFFSKYRAHCGIASEYYELGNCGWRDTERPTRILEKLCKRHNISEPVYTENCVKIVDTEFYYSTEKPLTETSDAELIDIRNEKLALCALRRWNEIPLIGYGLVPEHVETRSLFHPSKTGVEQGKLQVWLDIFPLGELPPPKAVDITPRKPIAYELRVIIWNTDEVILEEDDFFVGEKVSDIYVKGWITDQKESQSTDVHYRSMTGEGSFNWRFVFPFKYLSAEDKLVITKKEFFTIGETEIKMPCKLTLQVWDNDTFSADDFLGTLSLELAHLARGARSPKTCTLDNLAPHAPTINLFKTKRTKGWWPCKGVDKETKAEIIGGKIEAELELLTADEAEADPVGLARSEPHPLPKPIRGGRQNLTDTELL